VASTPSPCPSTDSVLRWQPGTSRCKARPSWRWSPRPSSRGSLPC
jgi:hypothetical protein